ncbi:MAG TPA: hypothetical protein VGN37_14755 [Actinocatenispora sp.]
MDRYALTEALLAAGLPAGSFVVGGVHEPDPPALDYWFLRGAPGRWEIGPYERGRAEVRETYEREADACARLLAILTGAA